MRNLTNKEVSNKAIRAYLNRHIDTSMWSDQISSVNMIEVLQQMISSIRDFKSPIKMKQLCEKLAMLYISAVGDQITVSLKEAVGAKIMSDIMQHPNGQEIFGRIMDKLGNLPSCGYYDPSSTQKIIKGVLADSEE